MYIKIKSQHLYYFRHRDGWGGGPFGPYFSSLLAVIQCSNRQGSCPLQVKDTHIPYSREFYGDVLHEGITGLLT